MTGLWWVSIALAAVGFLLCTVSTAVSTAGRRRFHADNRRGVDRMVTLLRLQGNTRHATRWLTAGGLFVLAALLALVAWWVRS